MSFNFKNFLFSIEEKCALEVTSSESFSVLIGMNNLL